MLCILLYCSSYMDCYSANITFGFVSLQQSLQPCTHLVTYMTWNTTIFAHRVKIQVFQSFRKIKWEKTFVCLTFENFSDTGRIGLLNYQEGYVYNYAMIYGVPLLQRVPSWKVAYDNFLCSTTYTKFYNIFCVYSIFFNSCN